MKARAWCRGWRVGILGLPLLIASCLGEAPMEDDGGASSSGGAAGALDAGHPQGSGGAMNVAHDAGVGGAGMGGVSGTGGVNGTGGAGGSPDAGARGGVDGGGGTGPDAGTISDARASDTLLADSGVPMSLTSTSLTAGGTFALANTCAGTNTSPPLTWTAGPAGTLSYAIILTDVTLAPNNVTQWVIWDIPAGVTSLPSALPGTTTLTTPVIAKQVHKIELYGAGGAYRGPCPGGQFHAYQFEVDAIFTATLNGVTAGTSTTEQVRAAVQAASLANATLNGISNATAPPSDANSDSPVGQ
jgi:Raf kinase inhibitor-like YbhB/YbcL family protein